jgi:tRNA pseudouridine38-40 synthase
MVGTVLDVGRGRTKPEGIRDIIAAKDRAAAGVCAPAQGLCLQWIRF